MRCDKPKTETVFVHTLMQRWMDVSVWRGGILLLHLLDTSKNVMHGCQ